MEKSIYRKINNRKNNKRRKAVNKMKAYITTVLVLITIVCLMIFAQIPAERYEIEATVIGKGTMEEGSKIEYFVNVENPNGDERIMLLNIDSAKENKLDSDRIYNYIEVGERYKFTLYKINNRYSNILQVR
jgi:cell division septal protein FtsQ